MSTDQISGQILRHQYVICVAEAQTFLLAKGPQRRVAPGGGLPHETDGDARRLA